MPQNYTFILLQFKKCQKMRGYTLVASSIGRTICSQSWNCEIEFSIDSNDGESVEEREQNDLDEDAEESWENDP